MIFKIEDRDRKEKIAREILFELPEWFGCQRVQLNILM